MTAVSPTLTAPHASFRENAINATTPKAGRSIITHPGAAHRDEFLACAILVYTYPDCPVFRRDAEAQDLLNPATMVVDQGRVFDPFNSNLDHHQFPRDAEACCSLTLVLKVLGLEELAREIWIWLEPTEVLDSKGPNVLADRLGTTADTVKKLISPVEGFLIRRFEKETAIMPGSLTHELLRELGEYLLEGLTKIRDRMDRLDREARFFQVKSKQVIDLRAISRTEQPTLGVETWCKKRQHDPAVSVSQDDRGEGLALYRRNDAPGVDFSRLEKEPQVHFAHPQGFIAKTVAGADPVPLLEKAIDG